jgi:hypothetical protein
MEVVGLAPCQYFSPGATQIMSPGRISLNGSTFALYSAYTGCNDQRLIERMGMPRRRLWGFLRQIFAPNLGAPQAKEQVKMIQGCEHQVNQGGLGLARLLEMGFEITDGVIARVRVAERVVIIGGAGFTA